MREGVIGGICLLAFLLSLGQAEDLDDPKKPEESGASALAGTDLLSNNERRNLNDDVNISKVTSNDLNKSDLTVSTNQSDSLGEPKSSIQTQNNVHNFEEILGRSGSNSSQSKEASETVSQPITAVKSNPTIPETQLPVDQSGRSLTPQGQVLLNSNTKTSKDSETTNNASPYYVGLNILPPLFASHVAGESATLASNESRFSPIFSSDTTHWAPPGSYASLLRNADSHSSTLPAFSDIPQPGVEYSRRELKKDDIQERNVDESQYSETMNSYPYRPPSDKSDSASNGSNEVRSGIPYGASYPTYQNTQLSSAQAYAAAQAQSNIDNLRPKDQGLNPYSYGYPPAFKSNSANVASASALAQFSNGAFGAQSSTLVIEDGRSRIIWPNELIFPNKIPGGENVIQCAKENELYHLWSRTFDCMVCICLNVYGLLEPICASCSGCQQPAPSEPPLDTVPSPIVPGQSPQPLDTYAPIPIPDPYIPLPLPNLGPYMPSASAPSLVVEPIGEVDLPTTPPPVREVPATCNPLPSGQPFTNPLHPCQICICKEFVSVLGKTEFRIDCQDNHNCVLPPDVTPIPPLPDVVVPVPLPACEKFPPHVSFPHPTESCKTCKCSLELSAVGLPEQQITCTRNFACTSIVEPTPTPLTPPPPPIPIPVEPYAGPVPEPSIEPVPENYPNPVPPPNAVTPEEPLPWPPLSTPAPPLTPLLPKRGPLPGPSPHDSCRPYPPNQPFQHPWDDCQVCQCSEIRAIGVVNVEISCYTKLSCCIESPDQVISAIAEASSAANGEDSQASATAVFQGSLSSTLKPTRFATYFPGSQQSQGYANANALAQNSGINAVGGAQYQGFAQTNAIADNTGTFGPGSSQSQIIAEANALAQNSNYGSQNQGYAEANALTQNSGAYAPGVSQNQGYTQAHALAQNTGVYGLRGSQNQGYAEANALTQNSGVYGPGGTQNQGYAETNALAQNSGAYGPGGSQNQGYAEANALAQNSVAYGPGVSQNQGYAEANALTQNSGAYGPGGSQNQGYVEANALAQNSGAYGPGGSQNQGYAEANALTQNSGAFGPGGSQNQGYAEANALTQNSGTYGPGGSQNQGYAEANALTQNSGAFSPGSSQNQVHAEANALTQNSGTYGLGSSQNQGYAEANALTHNSGAYGPGGSQNQGYAEANALAQNTAAYGPGASKIQGYAEANALAQNSGTYSPGGSQNLGYTGANVIAQNQPYGSYQSTNALSNAAIETIVENSNLGPFNPYNTGITKNQGYAEANAIAQNSLSNPKYPGLYQSANAYGSMVNGGSQTSAEASAEYNNLPTSFNPYNSAVSQNQAYAEANALTQNHPAYQVPGPYQPAKGISNMNSAETSDEYSAVTYKTPSLYSQYNPGISQSQAYADANSQYTRPVSTARPPTLYNPYNSDVTQNKGYAEALAQYNDLMTNTQKPPLYGQYSPSISQSQALAQANAQYNSLITTTYKPPTLYNPYNSDISQSPVYPQPNAIYTITSTPRPASLYGQYSPGASQNQAYAAANALQYPYNSGGSKYLENSGANAIAQTSNINNPGFYGAGSYQSASALGSASSDQSSAIAEAVAQSQDLSPYYQAGSQAATNTLSSPQYGYPYQSNYYGYQNPQLSSYAGKSDVGQNGKYKTSPVTYAGNYEFNGQADSISVLNPQNGYYPYTSGYSQGVPASSLYPSLYPQKSYEVTPLYRPGQFGGSSALSSAQAYAGSVTLQSKSGEGHKEDSKDSK